MSDNLLVVLPVISRPTADICVESIRMPDSAFEIGARDILVIDNTREGWADQLGFRTYRDPQGHNLGVARAWNVGAREVLDRGLDYLVICSTSMRFGPILHTSWRRQMETFWGANIVEAEGHSWHLIAIHRRVFERIGLFDENLYPAYYEANDFAFRMRMVGMEGNSPENPWMVVWVNALSQGHALNVDLVHCPAAPLEAYMHRKWGGPKGRERYDAPFGNMPLDYWPERSIEDLAAEYGLTSWW